MRNVYISTYDIHIILIGWVQKLMSFEIIV